MRYLWTVSLIWSASFGLISTFLAGLPASWLALVRLVLALLVLLPFFRPRGLRVSTLGALAGLGAVQYGLMYLLYFQAFPFLPGQAYLLALFTVTTPLYVVVIDDCFRRRWSVAAWLPLLLAIGGAAVINWPWGRETTWDRGFWIAFLLMQGSNAAFAFGQIGYRELKRGLPGRRDEELYAAVFAGAVLCALVSVALAGSWSPGRAIDLPGLLVLLFLGVVASGLGFLWWNKGATLVPARSLAIMNNVKIPLAVVVSLLVFQEYQRLDPVPFVCGSALLAVALVLARQVEAPASRSARHQR